MNSQKDASAAKSDSLDLLQEAQTRLDRAAEAICPIPGLSVAWELILEARHAVNRAWHQLEESSLPPEDDLAAYRDQLPEGVEDIDYVLRALLSGRSDGHVYSTLAVEHPEIAVSYFIDTAEEIPPQLCAAAQDARSYLGLASDDPIRMTLDENS